MLKFLKNLINKPREKQLEGKHFNFLIYGDNEAPKLNTWYRLERWKSAHYLKMNTKWSKDWKRFASEVPVVGVSQRDRQSDFLIMGDQQNFKIFLKRELNNPVDSNAIKVMGSATVEGEKMVRHLGYIPKDVAESLAKETEINATPHGVYLPIAGKRYGLRINVLVRSASFKKKKGNK